ncbi:unnamed protein product [Rotaria sordida]|uniref:Uncharacterized protein n=1 Tax=Rotaria sordida TaxID=392033 RepID=A0A814GMX6_9BILA|nr:unnamed protein product [Rotaria sordida]CAF1080679.1 unnamed protein product [Rotaria sordida]
MTIEQFRDCFVGEKGYDALKKLMKAGNELCTDTAKCWQERYDIEIAYAKGLRKNSETFQKLAGRAKGSLVQAFTAIATQTNIESEAHNVIANVLLNKISTPMKNLADTQLKARKPIEDVLNAKFKAWKDKKEIDTKYRQRQFENCKEIEGLYLKMDETPKTTKNSVKEVSKIETSLRKAEQELEKTEKKYHDSTKDVELARQSCDAEMCRSCDQMQMMELDRINEMEKFIQTYNNSIQKLCETMSLITQELYSIRITPQDDIITEGKLNVQTTETEILLYDIYAENEHNAMSQERRILSLMHWIQMLKQDIEIQRRSKDGIENLQGFCQQNQKFSTSVNSSEISVNRESVRLLQCLYHGSLYKMEVIYNQIKHLPEPQYEYSQRFAKSYTDKGTPTTFLRIPFQPLSQNTSPALSTASYLARTMPVVPAPVMMQQPAPVMMQQPAPVMMQQPAPVMMQQPAPPPPYPIHKQAPIGWAINELPNDHPAQGVHSMYNRSVAPTPPYPVLPNVMTASTDSQRQQTSKHVKVLHAYDAQHDDELSIRPGDTIVLLERRSDNWFKGILNGKIGLFPGNFVQELQNEY